MTNYNPEEKTFEISLRLNNEQASALYKAVRICAVAAPQSLIISSYQAYSDIF